MERIGPLKPDIDRHVDRAIDLARDDWDNKETSWGFKHHVYLMFPSPTVSEADEEWTKRAVERVKQMAESETAINAAFAEAFSLQSELDASIRDEEITLNRPDREEDIKHLVSYAIGCMVGRYSLDRPGLVYAQGGNQGFDSGQYRTFQADEDGIIPLTDVEWFEDDTANRFEAFVSAAWPKEHLEENLKFVAESLGLSRDERPRETIRRYLATSFYKHHLSMYKKRPIYWLFSSGKQRAFQCLVYLHRYNEGTLARMRTEYVIPLSGKMSTRIDQLAGDISAASSTSHRKRLEKERETLIKQREELQVFDEQLRHYADQRIRLDLDDGVKANYGRFGSLLAEVKAVTKGGSDE